MAKKDWRTLPEKDLTENEREARKIYELCPGYDLTLHGKCKKPDYYGIRLTKEADLVSGTPSVLTRKDKRKFEARYSFRLPTSESRKLLRAYRRSDCRTKQDFLREVVNYYIAQREAGLANI